MKKKIFLFETLTSFKQNKTIFGLNSKALKVTSYLNNFFVFFLNFILMSINLIKKKVQSSKSLTVSVYFFNKLYTYY